MELATIAVPADNGLAQYYTEEASGLFRARISRPVSNGTVTVIPLVREAGPDKGCMTPARDEPRRAERKASPLSEISRVFVRFDHIASAAIFSPRALAASSAGKTRDSSNRTRASSLRTR